MSLCPAVLSAAVTAALVPIPPAPSPDPAPPSVSATPPGFSSAAFTQIRGKQCGADGLRARLEQGGRTLVFTHPPMTVGTAEGAASHLRCSVRMSLGVPPGHTYAVRSWQARRSMSLPDGGVTEESFVWSVSSGVPLPTYEVSGPWEGPHAVGDTVSEDRLDWAPCDGRGSFVLIHGVEVARDRQPPGTSASVTTTEDPFVTVDFTLKPCPSERPQHHG